MKSIRIVVVLILFPLSVWAQNTNQVNWISFEQLDTAFSKKHLKVIIFFYTDWCVYCKKMKRVAFRNPEIVHQLNSNFYCVKMNAESTDTIVFGNKKFYNSQADTIRNGIHQIALHLAGRENSPFSLPVTVLLNKKFKIVGRNYEYLSPKGMLKFINKSL